MTETNTLATSKKLLPFMIIGAIILVILISFLLVVTQNKKSGSNQVGNLPNYPVAKTQIFTNNNSKEFGALAVTSKITGIQVTIDEKEVNDPNFFAYSNTPPFLVPQIPVGNHVLRAQKDGYLNSAITVQIKKDKLTSIEITLQPNPELINLKKAQAKMPIHTTSYNIEFLNFTGVTQVNVFNPPFEENKQVAIKWFQDQGVSDPEAQGVEFNDLTKRYVPRSN